MSSNSTDGSTAATYKNGRGHVLTPTMFRALARPTSRHLDEDEVWAYITECEDRYLIPAVGYSNFKAAAGVAAWADTFDETFSSSILLGGGEWEGTPSPESGVCGVASGDTLHFCPGLRKALAYYVYGTMLRADGTIITRQGAMRHRDDDADHVDDSKGHQYNETFDMAERYLSECLAYLRFHQRKDYVKPLRGSRLHIHAIGD